MTKQEFCNLQSRRNLYDFTFYHGEIIYGYPDCDYSNDKFYIRHPREKERGKPINPESITKWKLIDPNAERKYYASNGFSFSKTPKASKMVIIGAGASYGFS